MHPSYAITTDLQAPPLRVAADPMFCAGLVVHHPTSCAPNIGNSGGIAVRLADALRRDCSADPTIGRTRLTWAWSRALIGRQVRNQVPCLGTTLACPSQPETLGLFRISERPEPVPVCRGRKDVPAILLYSPSVVHAWSGCTSFMWPIRRVLEFCFLSYERLPWGRCNTYSWR
ncbi:hypothetical protein OH77DRAFT_455813 [Trametes cingulata]|nr:hypothetical protein OH77DRAFT_455813 [Trametes cingulata]